MEARDVDTLPPLANLPDAENKVTAYDGTSAL